MSEPDDDDFLGRWSARKLRARATPEAAPAPPPSAAAPAGEPPEAVAPKSDAEVLEELGLPDPDGLVKGDDFRAFLGAGVPAGLRARALRRLWLSDPVLANLDGLNDYDGDFTDKATVRPGLKTAYRVGKGFLRDPPKPASAAKGPAAPTGEPPSAGMATADRAPPGGPTAEAPAEPGAGAALEPAARAPAQERNAASPEQAPQRAAARQESAREEGARRESARAGAAGADRPRRMRFRFGPG